MDKNARLTLREEHPSHYRNGYPMCQNANCTVNRLGTYFYYDHDSECIWWVCNICQQHLLDLDRMEAIL